jgi:tripartite-type tricarboxylate transporter receptor subunit TctC
MKKIIATLVLALASVSSFAWPTKDITIINPYPAGGPSDVLTRNIAKEASAVLKTPIVVKNMPGAANAVAIAHILGNDNDNHTFFLTIDDIISGPLFQHNIHPYEKFQAVTIVGNSPWILWSNKNTDRAKFEQSIKNKDIIDVGTGPVMSPSNLWIYTMGDHAKFNPIPYKGASGYYSDVLAGHVTYGAGSNAGLRELVKADRVNLIMISSDTRDPKFPNVPTYKELGFKGEPYRVWYGIFTRKDTSAEAVIGFSTAVRQVVGTADSIKNSGFNIINSTPKEAQKFFENEQKRFVELHKKIGR